MRCHFDGCDSNATVLMAPFREASIQSFYGRVTIMADCGFNGDGALVPAPCPLVVAFAFSAFGLSRGVADFLEALLP